MCVHVCVCVCGVCAVCVNVCVCACMYVYVFLCMYGEDVGFCVLKDYVCIYVQYVRACMHSG